MDVLRKSRRNIKQNQTVRLLFNFKDRHLFFFFLKSLVLDISTFFSKITTSFSFHQSIIIFKTQSWSFPVISGSNVSKIDKYFNRFVKSLICTRTSSIKQISNSKYMYMNGTLTVQGREISTHVKVVTRCTIQRLIYLFLHILLY